jgi:hypothetical protein
MADVVNPNRVGPQVTSANTITVPQPQKKKGKFGRIFGGILGGVLNVAAPGAGTVVGNLIGGRNGVDFGSMEAMLAHSAQQQMQMIMLQNQVQNQSQEFTTISNLLAKRHENEMAAVRNFKS